MADGLTVGVTIYLHEGNRSMWVNGGSQNVVFLVRLLERCPGVKRVICINGGPGKVPPKGMLLDGLGLGDFPKFEAVADDIDLLIECGAQMSRKHAEHVHKRGGKVVGYKFGNTFVLDSEKLLKDKGDRLVFIGTEYDAIWTNPQHMHTNASFWEACYRAPVRCLPHIWEPLFVEIARSELGPGVAFEYVPGDGPKSVAIYEPNLNIVKTCLVPVLVCELAFRQRPELIETVYATNTLKIADQLTFKGFHSTLDIGRTKAKDGLNVLSIESRYILPFFQAKYADVVVTHQWENALNYVYYEALYGHYPLVHNSPMLPEHVGYRYHGFDAHDGADALILALTEHDAKRDRYNAIADDFLDTVSPHDQANVDAHQDAINEVMAA